MHRILTKEEVRNVISGKSCAYRVPALINFWLHACGNITSFLPDLIDLGVDIIHPVQKYAMDETAVASSFADQISFWAGFDVQRIIPWGSEKDVREEVRHLLNIYQRPGGRLVFSLGNGVNGECRLALLEALYDELFAWNSSRV